MPVTTFKYQWILGEKMIHKQNWHPMAVIMTVSASRENTYIETKTSYKKQLICKGLLELIKLEDDLGSWSGFKGSNNMTEDDTVPSQV